MSLARTWSVALVGVEGTLIELEADINSGIPGFTMIGQPDSGLREARDRVRAALTNSGEDWPQRRVTVALSPATMRKAGSRYDVAVAVALLLAQGMLPAEPFEGLVLLGELSLDGRLRPVNGILPATLAAVRAGRRRVVVPAANEAEAMLVPGAEVRAFRHLHELCCWARGTDPDPERLAQSPEDEPVAPAEDAPQYLPDLADVVGQAQGRAAVEIAAAGGHHLLMTGAPGAGKTMLAARLPGLLPPLDIEAALEVTAIHSVAGRLRADTPLITTAPFQAPHHTITVPGLVGGGTPLPKPGAASLAHRGVLFLDEAPEFAGGTLDALRQPLESGELVIARSAGTARFRARFTLVLAANPCPCAATNGAQGCSCPSSVRRRYLTRLSGPLLDRIDVRVEVLPVARAALSDPPPQETTATVAERVAAARARAAERLAGTPWRINADVPGTELRRRWPLPASVTVPADLAFTRGRLTLRGYDRVLRIAWTLADLRDLGQPGADEVAEAVGLRLPEELDGPTRAPLPAAIRAGGVTAGGPGRPDLRPVRPTEREEAS